MRKPSKFEIANLQSRLVRWFALEGRSFPWRKRSATLYQQILAEVLLQRTRAQVVARFLPKFLNYYPSWKRLATASEADLREFLQPLGLWRRRASSLLALAKAVAAKNGRFPKTRSEIESLPAVGQYICNAILLFANRRPEPLLDVNMARVIERCFGPRGLVDLRYDPQLQAVSRLVVSGPRAVIINWAILDLAALICTERLPRCIDCPLRGRCDFYKSGSIVLRTGTSRRRGLPLPGQLIG
jgi:A/G-specific adenine glycosylase